MRLINTSTLALREFWGDDTPRYAILSHTWEEEEVTFQQFMQLPREELTKLKGFEKIRRTCQLAQHSKIEWAWVDTCCIDKSSSAELTEAINSMFRWYAESAVCFAYLSDLQRIDNLSRCRWFTRGWTLQELIAPRRLGFYNSTWQFQGEKSTLAPELSEITGISTHVLTNKFSVDIVSVAQRMSWAAARQTTRAEDLAYCLLGLFHVQIPLLYGEGGTKAFIRLQEEILKETNDLSLLAWRMPTSARTQKYVGVLALSPQAFADSGKIWLWEDPIYNDEVAVTSKGLRVTPVSGGSLWASDPSSGGEFYYYILKLRCYQATSTGNEDPGDNLRDVGIYLRKHGCDIYTRVLPDRLARETGYYIPEFKGRTFYISKMVSPVLSMVLGSSSSRDAIDMFRARTALERAGFVLRRGAAGIEPVGHWDARREVFLTQGVRVFRCRLVFDHRVEPEMTLDCVLEEGRLDVNLEVDGVVRGQVLRKNDGKGRMKEWLTARVVKEAVGGQPMFVVEVDVSHVATTVGKR
ncbi:HET-domain-containing protein [Podospora conica]|nr:HET-domain-containing protein [Schizothecium conicum]